MPEVYYIMKSLVFIPDDHIFPFPYLPPKKSVQLYAVNTWDKFMVLAIFLQRRANNKA